MLIAIEKSTSATGLHVITMCSVFTMIRTNDKINRVALFTHTQANNRHFFFYFVPFLAFRYCITVSTLLQSNAHCTSLPSMEAHHDVLVSQNNLDFYAQWKAFYDQLSLFQILRNNRFQFPVQYDIHVSLLSDAGGGLVSG